MPWKETCPMEQRMEFVIQHRSGIGRGITYLALTGKSLIATL